MAYRRHDAGAGSVAGARVENEPGRAAAAPPGPRPPLPSWAMAHDLAGGVRGIVQLCALVEARPERLPPDTARQLAAIGRRARRLQGFLRDLQELERPRGARAADRGRRPSPAPPRADAAAAVRAVVAGLEPDLLALRPRLHLLGRLPPLAVAPVDLERLLANLIANALQHRSVLKPRLAISARPRPAGMVELAVADNGPGVPPGQDARLFEPFFRLPSARAPAGAGLGLAICRAVVDAYGGRIWAEAAPGGGSRFCCTLPAAAE